MDIDWIDKLKAVQQVFDKGGLKYISVRKDTVQQRSVI